MATASNLLKNLKAINVNDAVEYTLINKSSELLHAQRLQMKQGLSSNGKPFINKNTGTDEYAPSTAKRKGKKKPIDLFDKGDFQKELFVDVRENTFVIDSADRKTDKLIKQFGGEILGLNEDSRKITKPSLQIELKRQVKSQMNVLQPS